MPVKFVNFLKSRLIFNIFCCFWMFVNKLFTYLTCTYLKTFNVKSSTYYFQMKTEALANFQIRFSVTLNINLFSILWDVFIIDILLYYYSIVLSFSLIFFKVMQGEIIVLCTVAQRRHLFFNVFIFVIIINFLEAFRFIYWLSRIVLTT